MGCRGSGDGDAEAANGKGERQGQATDLLRKPGWCVSHGSGADVVGHCLLPFGVFSGLVSVSVVLVGVASFRALTILFDA